LKFTTHPSATGTRFFQEYETLDFQRPGYERYDKIIREMRQLSARLHENTKFERLAKYAAANLFYIVAEPAWSRPVRLPCGWGIAERAGRNLCSRPSRTGMWFLNLTGWHFLQRVAMAATRAVNREHGVNITHGFSG